MSPFLHCLFDWLKIKTAMKQYAVQHITEVIINIMIYETTCSLLHSKQPQDRKVVQISHYIITITDQINKINNKSTALQHKIITIKHMISKSTLTV